MTKTIKGREVSALGFGTFRLQGQTARQAVAWAIGTGYRHIDTARMYENETALGQGIADAGVDRDELFITSKVWRDDLTPDGVRRGVEASLRELKIDYLDLALIHWPNPEVPLRSSIKSLQALKEAGKIRHFGVSNFPSAMFEEAAELGEIFCDQVEYHPMLGQDKVLETVRRHGSALTAYCPLGQGTAVGEPTLEAIGRKHGKQSGQVALRWLIEQDSVLAIPRSSKREHIEGNFDIFDFELDDDDRLAIAALPKDRRRVVPGFSPVWD